MQWRRVLRENGEHSVDRTFLSPTSLRNFLVDVQKSSQKPSVLTCARSLSLSSCSLFFYVPFSLFHWCNSLPLSMPPVKASCSILDRREPTRVGKRTLSKNTDVLMCVCVCFSAVVMLPCCSVSELKRTLYKLGRAVD